MSGNGSSEATLLVSLNTTAVGADFVGERVVPEIESKICLNENHLSFSLKKKISQISFNRFYQIYKFIITDMQVPLLLY